VDVLLARLEERVGLSRADLLGVAIALLGCVVATVVALRVPLLAYVSAPPDPAGSAGSTVAAPAGDGATSPAEPGAPTGSVLVVHVAGAVHRPGVVELRGGDRVADALEAAGGATTDASLSSLNLARPLVDGEQVLVPTVAEEEAAGAVGAEGGGAAAGASELPDGRLDLNAASPAELEELPGVGPVLAARIVAHREEHGPFSDAAQLREVSGIGEATWASLRDLVGVR
jgi:competence protein ComEA